MVPDVGVLFVHGIGLHEAGRTLRHMGGALTEYVRRRIGADPAVTVEATQAGPSDDALMLTVRPSEGRTTTWRLQEARWDESFEEPTLGEVARWSLLVAPWILHREAFRWWARREVRGRARLLWRLAREGLGYVLRFVGFTLGAILLQVLLVLLVALAWSPPVRRALDAILVRTVGDAHRFIYDPEALSIMSVLVARELHHLSGGCRKVIVVAHSQGAAVARAAIDVGGAPQNLERVITLGAGLTKLHALQELRHRVAFLTYWLVLRLALLWLAVATFRGFGESIHTHLMLAVFLVAVFAPMRGVVRSERRTRELIARTSGLGSGWSWVDLWSTRDLVPEGRLRASAHGRTPHVTSLQVDNAGSWISDHVTYLSNSGQVLPLIYGVAARASGWTDPTLLRDVDWVWRHRSRRARTRGRGFLLAPFVCAALLLPIPTLLQVGDLGLPASALVLASPLIWARLWRRWEMVCRRWEPQGCTVVAGWKRLLRPSFWWRLPPAAPPPGIDGHGEHARWFALAIDGSHSAGPTLPDEAEKRHAAEPRALVLGAILSLLVIGAAAFPTLWELVRDVGPSRGGTSHTALIANALMKPSVVVLAVASVLLPGVALDALGEIASSVARWHTRRVWFGALACSLLVAGLGVSVGVILAITVRPIPALATGDCFDTHTANPHEIRSEQLHFDAMRIPCREPHEAQLLQVHPLTEGSLPVLYDPTVLAAETCEGVVARGVLIDAAGLGALRLAAYVPRSSMTLERGGGVYCFVAVAGCDQALVGHIARGVRIRARPAPVRGCGSGVAIATGGSDMARADLSAIRTSYQLVDIGALTEAGA
ncbi:MAG TPA: hypothetical protein VF097_12310 [Actinomycetota bacterium]